MPIGLDYGQRLAKLWHMPRPKKDPEFVRGEILKIPVTQTEKQRILSAAAAKGGEFAGWARSLLLKAVDAQGGKLGNRKRSTESRRRTA